jgi:cytidine deaminase
VTEEQIKSLVDSAIAASRNAYIPYSNYRVGAALLASDGTVYGGCNVENASYPATICAERTAFVKAVSEGRREFEAIAVVTRNGGSPCGICRQVMHELAPNLRVFIADLDGVIYVDTTIDVLLPDCFTPGKLKA